MALQSKSENSGKTWAVILKASVLLFWGAAVIGLPAFVVCTIYLPQGQYGIAAASSLLACLMAAPWVFVVSNTLKRTIHAFTSAPTALHQ
jgi:cation transporter-like permease